MQAIATHPAPRPHTSRSGRKKAAAAQRGSSARRQAARDRLIRLTRLMDGLFEIPVVGRKFGLDAVIGLVPVVGDLVSAGIGVYLVFEARELGASRWLQARMVGNLLFDLLLGAIPVLGDFFDVLYRAHHRNLKLLQREIGEPFIDAGR